MQFGVLGCAVLSAQHVMSCPRIDRIGNLLRRVFISEFLSVTSDCVHLSVSLSWIRNLTHWRGCKPHTRFALTLSFVKLVHTVHDRNCIEQCGAMVVNLFTPRAESNFSLSFQIRPVFMTSIRSSPKLKQTSQIQPPVPSLRTSTD